MTDWTPQYSTEEISALLAQQTWEDIPENWRNLKPQDGIVLRSHAFLESNSAVHFDVVHAAPRMITSPSNHRIERKYANFPLRACFVTAYKVHEGQKFYPDETLEFVHNGVLADNGVPLEEISTFDPIDHFETGITDRNEKIGTWIVTMPYPVGSALSTAVDRDLCRRTLVQSGSDLEKALMANAKPKGVYGFMAKDMGPLEPLIRHVHGGNIAKYDF